MLANWCSTWHCLAKVSVDALPVLNMQQESGLSSAVVHAQTDASACGCAGVEEGTLLARLCSSVAVPLAASILLQDTGAVNAVASLSGAPFRTL